MQCFSWLRGPVRLLAVLLFSGGALVVGHTAVLFEDSFDDGNAEGWAPYDDSLYVWEDGAFTGSGAGGNVIYASIHSCDYADYSFSVSLARTGGSAGSFGGIAMHVRPDGSRYLFGVSRYRGYWFARVSDGTVSVVADWTLHSALDSVRNALTVSCSGSTFRFYANGRFLGTVIDGDGPASGAVGVFVQHDARYAFDDIVVDDVPAADESVLPFFDTFDDDGLAGWFTHGGNVFTAGGGSLRGAGAGNGYLYRCYVSGAFPDCIAVTTVRRTGGSRYYPAGLSLRGQDDPYHSGYLFAVNGSQEFVFARTDSGVMTPVSGWTVHSAVRDSVNTLRAECDGGTFRLSVNGTPVGEYGDAAFAAGAVGVFVSDDVTASFDSLYVAADDGSGGITAAPSGGGSTFPVLASNPVGSVARMLGVTSGNIMIYSSNGDAVRMIRAGSGTAEWYLTDSGGRPVAAGLYLAVLPDGGVLRMVVGHQCRRKR